MSIQDPDPCYSIGELWEGFYQNLLLGPKPEPDDASCLDGDMTIAAVTTWYGGTTFRSRLEADWAATLDTLHIRWEYEPETIELPSGTNYIPDFRLPDIGAWLEVKGPGVPRIEKAIELGEARACHCKETCQCEWPDGELVLIGHPPEHSGPRRHEGHPKWSAAHGRSPWLGRCEGCHRGSWFNKPWCRACGKKIYGYIYRSGEPGIRFIRAGYRPRPDHVGEAA